jgi:DNA polymerase-3 subunit epsilon
MSHQTPADLELMARVLETSGDYRVLRRLAPRKPSPLNGAGLRRAVFLDVETTGLDAARDTVIELAMVPFAYDEEGRIVAVGESFASLRDPGIAIPAEVTRLTGIDDAMVHGAAIDAGSVCEFVDPAVLVVAHNAAFDRPFCEALWPAFADKAWACSFQEIDWKAEGFDSAKLAHLAARFGFFFDGHRAVDDCLAGIEILSGRLPISGRKAFSVLLDSARSTKMRVWAEGAPLWARTTLKTRGYKWSSGENGSRRAWFTDVREEDLSPEIQLLRRDVFQNDLVEIPCSRHTAKHRYSRRLR